jgi:hypothetical protein
MFVAGQNELEEQICGVLIERNISNFINCVGALAAQMLVFCVELPAGAGLLEAVDPPGRDIKQHPVTGLGGLDSEADR